MRIGLLLRLVLRLLRIMRRRRPRAYGIILLVVALIGLLPFLALDPGYAAQNWPQATNTPRPTHTPETSIPLTPRFTVEQSITTVAANSTLDIHTEPDFAAPVIATAARHTRFPVIGQITLDAQVWYQVALADGRTGWLPGIGGAYLDVHWRQVVETFDGVEMVRVPAGCFLMGSASEEPDEAPVHTQCFDEPFWIDRYAVSNRQYGSEGYFRGDSRPRESVDWFDAAAHCAGRDARLPTEAEWEYAARGPLALVYPWGNSFVDDYVISSWRTTARQTEAVGSHPEGASWVGAYNMSGNVWEWTASLYDEYPYDPGDGREDPDDRSGLRVVRGGACCSYVIADVRAAFRFAVDPHTVDANIGFRCARDAEIATG
jgi:hypothetical protein